MTRVAGPDHIVFWRGGVMMGMGFDAKARRVLGEPVALNQKTSGDPSSGVAYAAVASDGTLAFVPELASFGERRLVLTDRAGKARTDSRASPRVSLPAFLPGWEADRRDDRSGTRTLRRGLDL